MTQRPIDLFVAAHQKRVIDERLELPVGDGVTVSALLEAPDIYDIQGVQDILYRKVFAKYRKEGLHLEKIDEAEWERDLKLYDPDVRKLQEKPANYAQQGAEKTARVQTIQELIPKYLKDPATKELLFPTEAEQVAFKKIIRSDPGLSSMLAKAYINIAKKLKEVSKQAKNLSAPTPDGKSEKK